MQNARRYYFFAILMLLAFRSMATGEASTYFQLYVPPNNDAVARDVCLIVTALYDNTNFQIIDDGADGDTDDSVTGTLQAGQSYVLYIRENGVNDDAPHRNESPTKQDGDYFIVQSSKLVTTSMSTNSDWQHDWVPSTSRKGVGKRFFVFAPATSNSPRDLNAFAYQDSTEITIWKITQSPLSGSGYTQIDRSQAELVLQQRLNLGEDLIMSNTGGRDLLQTGYTYLVESSNDISLQYGALHQNARDGGGYVPASNGGSAGELFYFAVPVQGAREQEIRIVSWDNQNVISLDYYNGSQWVNIQTSTLDSLETLDWISTSGNINKVFRVTCGAGKKASVFEANWLETGSPGTSDIATTVSAENGTTAGERFLVYMAPPGNEQNVSDPLNGGKMGKLTHAYLFSRFGATVRVRDSYTMGQDFDSTFVIPAGRYADCALDLATWQSIYNGTGSAQQGPERPYLLIESDKPISVLNTNHNDNWMTYFGSPQPQSFDLRGSINNSTVAPGDTIAIAGELIVADSSGVGSAIWEISVADGLIPLSATLTEFTTGLSRTANPIFDPSTETYLVTFDNLPLLQNGKTYETNLTAIVSYSYVGGAPIAGNTVLSVEHTVRGTVSGNVEQASEPLTVVNNPENSQNTFFRPLVSTSNTLTTGYNHWGSAVVDYDKDGWPDLFFPGYETNEDNVLYFNDQNGDFSSTQAAPLTSTDGSFVSSTWADMDNDGDFDVFVSGNIRSQSKLYRNDGRGRFTALPGGDLEDLSSYAHNAAWADYNRDGLVDLFVTNYMSTGFNSLFRNEGNGVFSLEERATEVISEASNSIGAVWADYDRDGDPDLFVPNTENNFNSLYRNDGSGSFTRMDQLAPSLDRGHSVGASWGDYDNDGWQDLFVSNAAEETNFFYRNNGDGSFTKIDTTNLSILPGHSTGSSWGDYNNDGWLDLFVSQDQGQANRLYLNDQNGDFRIDSLGPATAGGRNDFAVANGDFDRDGDLDLAIATEGSEPDAIFFNNRGQDNNWISIYLEGTVSNLAAIGAEVSIKAVIDGQVQWQTRELSSQTGGGAGSENELMAHFGLGDAIGVDSVEIRWPSGYIQQFSGLALNNSHTIREPDGASVSGTVYYDKNKNCQQDQGEQGIPGMIIEVLPGPVYFQTDELGNYAGSLPPGSYTFAQVPDATWKNACTQTMNVQVQNVGQVLSGLSFADTTSCVNPDLQVSMGNASLRQGFEGSMQLFYANLGGGLATGTMLSLTLDASWVPASADPVWTSASLQNGSWIVQWNLDSLEAMEQGRIVLYDSVNASISVGQFLSASLSIASNESDCQGANNSISENYEVFGAIDPNDLLAFPAGVGPQGYIDLDQAIRYRIRFQNVGNLAAERVVITDTLPAELDIESLELLEASHPAQFQIGKDRVMRWTFEQIQLPDSFSNEPESHGFVEFVIQPRADLAPGTSIHNTAHIRFDFAASIQTNTTLHTIWKEGEELGESMLWLSPNPAKDYTRFWLGDDSGVVSGTIITDIELLSIQGKRLFVKKISNPADYNLVTRTLKPGLYTLRARSSDGQWHSRLFIVP